MTARSDDPNRGAVLAHRYRLDGIIGEGAMGTVYGGVDLGAGANPAVAIKILHPHLLADERLVERFEREIAAGRRVAHPNLVPVLDDGRDAAFGRYLVMPLLPGSDLRRELPEGIGLRRTIALAEQLLSALEHMHGLGLVHRDVKPENIRLVHDDAGREHLFLLDFGLVKPLGTKLGERRLTECGRVFGTPWYMAPEQAMGERIDHRVDLYSVGAVMFEMLTGAPPFEGSLASVLTQQISAPVPALPTWVPPAITRVIGDLLAKEPAARPASAGAVIESLRRAIAGVSAQPTVVDTFSLGDFLPPALPPVSMLRASRRQGRVLAATFCVAAAIAAAFGLSGLGDAQTAEAAIAPAVATIDISPAVSSPVIVPVAVPVLLPAVAPAAPIAAIPPTVEPTPIVIVVDTNPVERPRTSGVEHPPSTAKPSRPRVKPTPKMPEPEPPKQLRAKKPPRALSKLPGATPASVAPVADGKRHIRPRTS